MYEIFRGMFCIWYWRDGIFLYGEVFGRCFFIPFGMVYLANLQKETFLFYIQAWAMLLGWHLCKCTYDCGMY